MMVVYNKQCKVCNHFARLDVEKLILKARSRTNMNYQDILDEITEIHDDDSLSRKNISDHYTKHMIPARNEALERLMEEAGIQAYNSINLLTELIDDWRESYQIVKESTDYDDPRQKNALATAQRLGMNLIKLNTDLLGEDEKGEFDLSQISKYYKMVRKQQKETEESAVNDLEKPTQTT